MLKGKCIYVSLGMRACEGEWGDRGDAYDDHDTCDDQLFFREGVVKTSIKCFVQEKCAPVLDDLDPV